MMAITTGVVKIGPDGVTRIGKIEKAHLPWFQSVYTKLFDVIVTDAGFIRIPYDHGYPLYDQYFPAILGGLNLAVYESNSFVSPIFTQDIDLTWADVSNPLYNASGVAPGNAVRVLDSSGQIYQTYGSDGYMHEVVGLIGYRESNDLTIKEHVIFFGYKSEQTSEWTQVNRADIYIPQVGELVNLYIPTSIDVKNYLWTTNLDNETAKQIVTQEYKIECVPQLEEQTTGAVAFATFDLRFLPHPNSAVRGYLNGIEVNVVVTNKAEVTSDADVIIDLSSPTYPICDVYWNGTNVGVSNLGDLVLNDTIRLYCVGKSANKLGFTPFAISGSPPPWTPAALGAVREADWDPALATIVGGKAASVPSPNGHTASNADAATRPAVNVLGGFANGAQALYFNKTTLLTLEAAIAGITAAHAFLVFKSVEDPAVTSQQMLWQFGPPAVGMHFPFADGNIYDHFGTTERKTVGNPAADLRAVHCYEVITKANQFTARLDGAEIFTTATNAVGWHATQVLGNHSAGAMAQGFIGWWARLIICNAELAGADIANMRGYLARYGVTFA